MKNKIELLTPDTITKKNKYVALTDYWCQVLNMQIGWHYIQDLSWILKNIDNLKLPKGSTILDAGAGNGILQYILASKGYNIYSVDFSNRTIHKKAKYIFKITNNNNKQKFNNNYIKHLKSLNIQNKIKILTKQFSKHIFNFKYYKEFLSKEKQNYGTINYHCEDFRKINLPKNSIDCIVSVSAIEHNNIEGIKNSIKEFQRILKPNKPMIITTSATNKNDWFHKPSQGWCFSEKTIKTIFDIKKTKSNFNEYTTIFNKIKNSKQLQIRIPNYYYQTGDNGMPWGKWDPKYIPVGIIKWKNIVEFIITKPLSRSN